jgi:hypothetical protein
LIKIIARTINISVAIFIESMYSLLDKVPPREKPAEHRDSKMPGRISGQNWRDNIRNTYHYLGELHP